MPMSETEGAETPLSATDEAFRRAQRGNHDGFSEWVRRVEIPLRASLRRFARRIDAEAVVQEALLRMWILAPRLRLEGEEASFRYVLRIARNLALNEAGRLDRFDPLDPAELENSPEGAVHPDPPPDP